MTEKDLHRLKRTELLEMLVEQGKEVESLKKEVSALKKQLDDRTIRLKDAGNIAEAALQISGIFEAAQTAAEHYLENVALLSGSQKETCEKMEAETKAKCSAMELETNAKCAAWENETKKKCQQMEEEAKKNVEVQWSELSKRLEAFYEAHQGLKELVSAAAEVRKKI
ncbi:MAG: hypothetical protein J6B94_00075 [Lachnospiraceae bacterium]|nr:hypothetical protein [Lachnospiraceae bacterium]